MIDHNNVKDHTKDIREKRHSGKIRESVTIMIDIIRTSNGVDVDDILMKECSFMFHHYTDLYNRIKKREIDLTILWEFLNVLEKIENGEADQHTAAFEVGSLLKKLYIDSAVKRADARETESETQHSAHRNITWREYNEKKKYNLPL
jgi:hypothetical protein